MKNKINNYYQFIKYYIRYLNNPYLVLRILTGYFNTILLKKNVLRAVEIAPSFACNSRCVMCSCAKMLKRGEKPLSIEEIRSIGEQANKLGAVMFIITGGEPTLRKDLCEIIKVLNPQKNIISIVTNGLILDRKMIFRLKEAGLNTIEFSLESDDDKENDKIRGIPGHFKKVMESIKNAKEANLNVCLSTVVTHKNLDTFRKMVKFAKKIDAFLLLVCAGIVGRWDSKDDLRITKKDWNEIEEIIRKNPFVRGDFSLNFSGKVGCPAGNERAYISSYGDVLSCAFNQISFGNIRNESLEKIWKRITKFPYYKKRSGYCIRTLDIDYIKKYLDPIKLEPHEPISIFDHPEIKKYHRRPSWLENV